MSQAGLATRRRVVHVPSTHRPRAVKPRREDLELKITELQRDYAELHSAIFEAAQVHRRLCAPRLVRTGDFEIANEIFAVRHLAGDGELLASVDKAGEVRAEKDPRGRPTAWIFTGGGWGHGAGMCQWGAVGRAEAGHIALVSGGEILPRKLQPNSVLVCFIQTGRFTSAIFNGLRQEATAECDELN